MQNILEIKVEIFEKQSLLVQIAGEDYGLFVEEDGRVVSLGVEEMYLLIENIFLRLHKEKVLACDAFVFNELLVVKVDDRYGPVVLHVPADLAPTLM